MQVRSRLENQAVSHTKRLTFSSRVSGLAVSLVLWCMIAAIWGAIFAWRYRNFMNPDGISYLDIASETLRTGPLALVNSYWSPLYPALIAVWEWICQPPPLREFPYIHALNGVIYTAGAVSFTYFFRELLRFRSSAGPRAPGEPAFIAFGFAVFFRFMNADLTAFVITPDLLVAVAAFLSAGLFLRILKGAAGWGAFAALGGVIAAGYLAKAVMLPAGVMLLCLLLAWSPRSKPHRNGVLIAATVMFVLCAPEIILVSQRTARFSISEAGRLNYLWFVAGLPPFQGWTGTPGGDMPQHGPRIITDNPETLEFASPIPGTYPLWYDPGYWYAGATVRFDLVRELHVIRSAFGFYRSIFGDFRLLLEGLVVVAIFAYVRRHRPRNLQSLLLLWPVAVLSMYALVWTEPRFIAPFLVIFWIGAYAALLTHTAEERMLMALLAGVILASNVRQTFADERKILVPGESYMSPYTYVWLPVSRSISTDQITARMLIATGLKTGDTIATVGDAFSHFYARIARLRVVAEIVDAGDFWKLERGPALALEQKLAGAGAKALIARSRPKSFQPDLWQDIPETPYSILIFRGHDFPLPADVRQRPTASRTGSEN